MILFLDEFAQPLLTSIFLFFVSACMLAMKNQLFVLFLCFWYIMMNQCFDNSYELMLKSFGLRFNFANQLFEIVTSVFLGYNSEQLRHPSL